MSPFDYLTRAEPFDPRGTPYAGDAQAQPLNALARIFGQEETAVDPTRRYGSANALKGTPDAYWSEAMMTPGQRTARNILASEPVQTVMNWANFAGPAMRAMPRPTMAAEGTGGIRAYHGSPHDFDRFDISKIGTGEGAQAYGHGLYFAESPKVAESYRSSVQYKPMPTATDPKDRATDLLWHARGNKDVAKYTARELYGRGEEGKAVVDAIEAHQATPGRMYEVRINASPEDFLDWDKPLSAQSEKVRKALVEFGQTPQDFDAAIAALRTKRENPISRGGDTSGYVKAIDDRIADLEARKTAYDVPAGQFLERLSYGRNDVKDQTSASARLREAGIPGIRYKDQGSRGTEGGTSNYPKVYKLQLRPNPLAN